MKKIIALIISVISVLTLCGCSSGKDAENNGGDSVTLGTVEGNVYQNDSIDVTFTKTDAMLFATDEELHELMSGGLEIFKDGNLLFEHDDHPVNAAFLSKEPVTGNYVLMVIEDLIKTGNSGITDVQYYDVVKKQLEEQTSDLKYDFGEIQKVELGGESYSLMPVTVSVYGEKMLQNMYIRKVGTYMIGITITVFDKTPVSAFEEMFS